MASPTPVPLLGPGLVVAPRPSPSGISGGSDPCSLRPSGGGPGDVRGTALAAVIFAGGTTLVVDAIDILVMNTINILVVDTIDILVVSTIGILVMNTAPLTF